MKNRPRFTSVRADLETRAALERLARATERSVPKVLRLLVLRAERELADRGALGEDLPALEQRDG